MNYFKKILVPVDFSINTHVALKKAIDLNASGSSVIHILHVTDAPGNAKEALDELIESIKAEHPGVNIEPHVVTDTKVEPALIRFAKECEPDLIVIGKNNHHSFFPFLNTVISANITEETKCPVLTVKPGSLNKKLDTVIMPVSDLFPNRKIELLTTLNNNRNLNVHLLTILDNNQQPDSHSASALLQSMKLIRGRLQCNVQHCIIHSDNKAIATLRYAEKVNADVLLVTPETETTINTWISKKDITDIVRPASQLQVLSVQAI